MQLTHVSQVAIELCLQTGRTLSVIEAEHDLRVVCGTGVIWATVAGDPTDIVLHPGETRILPARRQIVLQALADAKISIGLACDARGRPFCEDLSFRAIAG